MSNIIMLQQRGWALTIGQNIAKRLNKDGHNLGAITFKKSTDSYIRQQNDINYEFIINHDDIYESPIEDNKITLTEICDELDIDSIWLYARAMRNQVYCYADKYYFSYRQNRSDEEIVLYIKSLYFAFKKIFDEFRPDYVFGPNFVSLPQIILYLFSRKYQSKMITITDTKISGYSTFIHSYNLDKGPLIDYMDSLNKKEIETDSREKAKTYISKFREDYQKPKHVVENKKTLSERIKHEILPYYEIIRFYLKGNVNKVKNLGVTIDNKTPKIILRDHYLSKIYEYKCLKRTYFRLEDAGKFVYFPLQVQPEAVIDQLAPEFSNQIETARLIAMALPNDYTLVVKEHPWMSSRRSPSYHDKIARLPNVKLIDFRCKTETVLKSSSLVVSPGGTILAEAAFYNIPALQLGKLGITMRLPNVYTHTDMTTLSKKIKSILSSKNNDAEYEWKLENYISACFDLGFELDYNRIYQHGGSEKELDELYKLYVKEMS